MGLDVRGLPCVEGLPPPVQLAGDADATRILCSLPTSPGTSEATGPRIAHGTWGQGYLRMLSGPRPCPKSQHSTPARTREFTTIPRRVGFVVRGRRAGVPATQYVTRSSRSWNPSDVSAVFTAAIRVRMSMR